MIDIKRKEPTQAELKRLFHYNPITGELTFKKRPGNNRFNIQHSGKPAGTIENQRIRLKIGDYLFYASRMIYIMMNGKIPKGKIVDHKNGNSLDNRISNLRTCTYSQNSMNRKAQGELGLKGVTRFNGKFMSRTYKSGKCYYLGLYESAMEAGLAYDDKAKKLHGEFATLNFA